MKKIPQHTVYLQDGTLCNFEKRVWKKAKPLLSCFRNVTDPRKKRGIRHELTLILFILFGGITTGSTTLKDCHLWAVFNWKFLSRYFLLLHGIPDPTTISYVLQKVKPEELVQSYLLFVRIVGVSVGDVVSADGKTMRGVTGGDTIRHILSLFSHLTHTVVSQIGVTQKENEIPALRRLLEEGYLKDRIKGCLFLADALHANAETAEAILLAEADYLLVIKGNQKDFFADIVTSFTEQKDLPGTNYQKVSMLKDSHTEEQKTRKRDVTTTVSTTNDSELCAYLIQQHGFEKIQTVGILRRSGARTTKDGTSNAIDETVCFVSSRKLSAKQTSILLRSHWCIENNLHWVKDFVFLEDRQTLRTGNAPQVMSFLRSMCISIFNLLKFQSVSDALHNFEKSKTIHYQFLRMAAVV
jgi:predicted transposase YbfD/YdcC